MFQGLYTSNKCQFKLSKSRPDTTKTNKVSQLRSNFMMAGSGFSRMRSWRSGKIPSTCHCKSLAQMSCCIKIIDFTIRRSDCGSCQVYETIKFNDMYSLPIKSILPTAKYFSNHIQTQYMHTCIHTFAHLCILNVF